jgi:hypothetical protein
VATLRDIAETIAWNVSPPNFGALSPNKQALLAFDSQ